MYKRQKELIKFICYDKWTISSDVGWIKFESPTEGNGNAIIRISVDKNTSEMYSIPACSLPKVPDSDLWDYLCSHPPAPVRSSHYMP